MPPTSTARTDPALRARDAALLGVIWLIALALNLDKAVHVDDTAHLLIAEHIARYPLHPMSGTVLWADRAAPIHALNQPHLFFYLVALARALAGGSLLGPRLLVAAVGALPIGFIHRLALARTSPARALACTALVFLGPGFLPGQNLMADVPLLALGLAMLCALTGAPDRAGNGGLRDALLAGALLGLACLVKYTALPWLSLLPLDAWLRRDPKRLLGLLPALGLLGAYAAFNVADYGGVHLLERPLGSEGERSIAASIGIALGRGALYVMTLGAIAPHTIALAPSVRPRSWGLGALACALFAGGAQALAHAEGGPDAMRGEPIAVSVLRAIFFLVGLAALAHALAQVRARDRDAHDDVILAGFVVTTTLWVVVLAPFVAVRHVLLILGPLVLLSVPRLPPSRAALPVAVLVSATLGVLVAISDADLAATYREAAARWRDISVTRAGLGGPPGRHAFYAGHWGWQWYASQSGLTPYEPGMTDLASGDLIIRPRLPDPPALAAADLARCPVARSVPWEPGPLDFLRTITPRQGFYAVWEGLPWTPMPAEVPLERFDVHLCR